MEDIFNKEENVKNLYVIRHKLGELKPLPWASHYEWQIGHYRVKIFPPKCLNPQPIYLTQYEKVDVQVYEVSKREDKHEEETLVKLIEHPLFKNYKAIQYDVITTPNGTINRSNGDDIPIGYLCELIRYLHRLANLAVFM